MNSVVPSRNKKKTRLSAKAIPEPVAALVVRDASILFFPVNVPHFQSSVLSFDNRLILYVWQVQHHPTQIKDDALTDRPEIQMDASSFGEFSQQMSDFGLIFDIAFTDDELEQLPDWTVINNKILTGISSIYPRVSLPERPSGIRESVNSTMWSFVKIQKETIRKTGGRRKFFFNPPPSPPTLPMFCLDILIKEFGVENPVSRTNNALVPKNLIIVCTYFS